MAPEDLKATSPEAQERQDQSIKSRKFQLFDDDDPAAGGPAKPFADYLRATPPAPMSAGVKAAFWGAGGVLILILLAALLGGRGRKPAAGGRRADEGGTISTQRGLVLTAGENDVPRNPS